MATALSTLNGHKSQFQDLAKKKDAANANYSKYCLTNPYIAIEVMIMKLKEYEKTALKFYTNNNDEKKIVTAVGFETDSVANKMAEELGNPYRLMFQWIQIEVQELHALKESIDSLKNIDKIILSLKSETNDLKTELNDLAAGRTTIKSIWKAVIRQTPTQDELIRRIET